jgi:steroid delta-isomerase-like uncharacterized protein
MSIEENKALNQRFYDEVVNGRNYDVIDELVTADFVEREEIPGTAPGKAGVRQAFEMMHAAFPDLKATIEEVVAEGDWVTTHSVFSGTHQGEWMGVAASGKSISVNVVDFVRFSGGKVVEHWGMMDALTMMQQIGAIPEDA